MKTATMKSKSFSTTLTLAVAMMVTAWSSHSMAFLNKEGIEKKMNQVIEQKSRTSSKQLGITQAETCANFSGKWKGVCKRNQTDLDLTGFGSLASNGFEIEQFGCLFLHVKDSSGQGSTLFLNSMNSFQNSNILISFGGGVGYAWNKNKAVIEGVLNYTVNSLIFEGHRGGSLKSQTYLQDNKTMISRVDGVMMDKKVSEECVFEKQP